jgi:hypothetical protein
LAAALDRALFDDVTRAALDRAMTDYARSWTFADVATRFAEIVESTIAASSKPFIAAR